MILPKKCLGCPLFLGFICWPKVVGALLLLSAPLALLSFRCPCPYRSRVDATDMDPIQSSADVKEASYCVQEILALNNQSRPRFAFAPVLDRIRASPREQNGSNPNWYGCFIRFRRKRIANPNGSDR